MRKIKKLSVIFILILVGWCNIGAFGDESKNTSAQLKTTLSGFRLAVSYTNGFNLYNIDKYSENSFGANVGFEYTLLPGVIKNFDFGFYGRGAFQKFVPCNLQLESLKSYSFSGGIFSQWNLPCEFSLNLGAGMGFLISEIEFVSAEKGSVDDIYYDFMIETDFSARKIIIMSKIVDIIGDAGIHYSFYNEKTESFMSIGPSFGLILDFKPLSTFRINGAKK